MDLKINYLVDNPILIQKLEVGNWIDIPLQQDLNLLGDPTKLVPLGFSMTLPVGYEALIVPRSSTFKRYGLIQTNSMGVIDNSYSGPNDQWYWPCFVLVNKHNLLRIKAGTRLCQFRIIKTQPKSLELKVVDKSTNKDRGGLGSTGL